MTVVDDEAVSEAVSEDDGVPEEVRLLLGPVCDDVAEVVGVTLDRSTRSRPL